MPFREPCAGHREVPREREDRMDASRPGRLVSVIVPSADWERKPEPDMDGFGGIERGGGKNGVRGA